MTEELEPEPEAEGENPARELPNSFAARWDALEWELIYLGEEVDSYIDKSEAFLSEQTEEWWATNKKRYDREHLLPLQELKDALDQAYSALQDADTSSVFWEGEQEPTDPMDNPSLEEEYQND